MVRSMYYNTVAESTFLYLVFTFEDIIEYLQEGKVAIVETDTLYALTADASNSLSIQKIFQFKKRKPDHPLPILVRNLQMADNLAYIPKELKKDLSKLWPGPYTIVLQAKKNNIISPELYHNNTIALRVPGASPMSTILKHFRAPLVGTSANISGYSNLYKIHELEQNFPNIPILGDDINKNRKSSKIFQYKNDKLIQLR